MEKIRILLTGIGGYASTYVNPLLDQKYPDCEIAGCADPYLSILRFGKVVVLV